MGQFPASDQKNNPEIVAAQAAGHIGGKKRRIDSRANVGQKAVQRLSPEAATDFVGVAQMEKDQAGRRVQVFHVIDHVF